MQHTASFVSATGLQDDVNHRAEEAAGHLSLRVGGHALVQDIGSPSQPGHLATGNAVLTPAVTAIARQSSLQGEEGGRFVPAGASVVLAPPPATRGTSVSQPRHHHGQQHHQAPAHQPSRLAASHHRLSEAGEHLVSAPPDDSPANGEAPLDSGGQHAPNVHAGGAHHHHHHHTHHRRSPARAVRSHSATPAAATAHCSAFPSGSGANNHSESSSNHTDDNQSSSSVDQPPMETNRAEDNAAGPAATAAAPAAVAVPQQAQAGPNTRGRRRRHARGAAMPLDVTPPPAAMPRKRAALAALDVPTAAAANNNNPAHPQPASGHHQPSSAAPYVLAAAAPHRSTRRRHTAAEPHSGAAAAAHLHHQAQQQQQHTATHPPLPPSLSGLGQVDPEGGPGGQAVVTLVPSGAPAPAGAAHALAGAADSVGRVASPPRSPLEQQQLGAAGGSACQVHSGGVGGGCGTAAQPGPSSRLLQEQRQQLRDAEARHVQLVRERDGRLHAHHSQRGASSPQEAAGHGQVHGNGHLAVDAPGHAQATEPAQHNPSTQNNEEASCMAGFRGQVVQHGPGMSTSVHLTACTQQRSNSHGVVVSS